MYATNWQTLFKPTGLLEMYFKMVSI